MIIVGAMMVLGLVASWILFYRFPGLERGDPQDPGKKTPSFRLLSRPGTKNKTWPCCWAI